MSVFLGLDIGSSSVKATLLDVVSGEVIATVTRPNDGMSIDSPQAGFAEQHPDLWWEQVIACCQVLRKERSQDLAQVQAIGIAYQMHGLVALDEDLRPLRSAIIWCDSRAVQIGERVVAKLSQQYIAENLRNAPGNFTASKLRWVLEHQPELAARIKKICLPGDYIALRLTGELVTTAAGLSEGIMWDSKQGALATDLLDAYQIDSALIPPVVATFSNQGRVMATVAAELGVRAGIPVSYRAGDQPNNALSLGVLEPGEIAATAGTSGVVYAVSDTGTYDSLSRVNVFLHVNHQNTVPRYGTLLCINGCGALNSWIRKTIMFSESASPLSYREMDLEAANIAPGSEGLYIYPYGNGAERSLNNRLIGASFEGLDLNRHQRAHIYRAAQEGIVFALVYGLEALHSLGVPITSVRAGMANMFQSAVFQSVFSNAARVPLILYNTDGSCGAARGAAIGAGLFSRPVEAFNGLKVVQEVTPDKILSSQYQEVYNCWKQNLKAKLHIN